MMKQGVHSPYIFRNLGGVKCMVLGLLLALFLLFLALFSTVLLLPEK